MSERPIEEIVAGDAFREKMLSRADSDFHGAPLWHGWVIMDAFLAGVDYARSLEKVDAAARVLQKQTKST